MPGLLIDGAIVPVPGVNVINTSDAAWAHLSREDGTPRMVRPNKIILHKTLADDPERVVLGLGPLGHPQRTAEAWAADPTQSGAHLVAGAELVACLADLVRFEAYDANQANLGSIGIEHCEEQGGYVRQATLDNGVAVIGVICARLGIQLQYPRLPYHEGQPLKRFGNGGRDLVGLFGHRDVTDRRGRWDPGDAIWGLLAARLGAEPFDFAAGQDLEVWSARQRKLNAAGANLVVDGIPGPATTAALRAVGYRDGIWAFGRTS